MAVAETVVEDVEIQRGLFRSHARPREADGRDCRAKFVRDQRVALARGDVHRGKTAEAAIAIFVLGGNVVAVAMACGVAVDVAPVLIKHRALGVVGDERVQRAARGKHPRAAHGRLRRIVALLLQDHKIVSAGIDGVGGCGVRRVVEQFPTAIGNRGASDGIAKSLREVEKNCRDVVGIGAADSQKTVSQK